MFLDPLHAAGTWMAEHPHVTLVATNWKGDLLYQDDEDRYADVPRHRLELVVNRDPERGNAFPHGPRT